MKLDDIKSGSIILGIVPEKSVKIKYVDQSSPDSITVGYKLDDGNLKERQLFRKDEDKYSLAEPHFSFTGDAEDFKLAMEANRISNAHLFDPFMAIHSSNVIPLPHQITAVYESMLPKQPLRYVLADDPGAGKTIMAGLLIRELIARADAERILIVCPGSLVEQWQDELDEKFNLKFRIFSNEMNDQCRGNVFEEYNCLIARMDQLKRSEEYLEKLKLVNWDIVIVDEAHKMSASYSGNEVKKTERFKLGELLSYRTKHFLLMTATPHNGIEEDFQLFLSLIDEDRFYYKFRGSAKKVDVSDIMRRMCKEDLLTFEGTKLFPERRAISATYDLSDIEMDLYEAVTQYVREEMNKAERLDNNKKGNVGFALTSLQRRLASSPEAIHKSLESRINRLIEKQKEWERNKTNGDYLSDVMGEFHYRSGFFDEEDGYEDDLTGEEFENKSDEITDRATASRSIEELKKEIETLKRLEKKAQELVNSQKDKKWEELSSILQNNAEMRDKDGKLRKLVIFTEYRATLNYLYDRITGLLGNKDMVVCIHGGIKREARRENQERFRNDPDVRVLIATDAAGEGVNLQVAHLMINYDLPWNPNRIEQRFGRIHRIGQTEVCYLWNLIAVNTREGSVFNHLFEKLEREREALGGKVFDVLGDLFEGKSLKELLLDAIRYGEDPKRKEELMTAVEGALDTKHIEDLIRRNALTQDFMSPERLFSIRDEMEKAEARKLQPFFVRSYFLEAFKRVGGSVRDRESRRYEITYVPQSVIAMDKQLIGRDRVDRNPVIEKYDRVCFDKNDINGKKQALLLHPGHPLMRAVTGIILDKYGGVLKQGTVLVDPTDEGIEPHILCVFDHKITEGGDLKKVISRRYQFILIDKSGETKDAGFAPHLDYRPMTPEESEIMSDAAGNDWQSGKSAMKQGGLDMSWIGKDVEEKALAYANEYLVPRHYKEVRERREADIDKTKLAVSQRLTSEIDYLTKMRFRFEEDVRNGKGGAIPSLEKVKSEIRKISDKLDVKKDELEKARDVSSQTPIVVGACVVLPIGLLNSLKDNTTGAVTTFSADTDARDRIEYLGMKAVFDKEKSMGYEVTDVSKENCGWDITSKKIVNGEIVDERHIEVKGKSIDSPVVTISSNEIRYGLNQQDKFLLAIVIVDGDNVDAPKYIRKPFTREPAWGVVSENYNVKELLTRSEEF